MESEVVSKNVQSLSVDAIVDLFEIDTDGTSDGKIRIYGGKTRYGNFVYWQGEKYIPIPLSTDGFEKSSSGQLPRPRITVANISGLFSPIVIANDNLTGLKITRKRTFEQYLDGRTWLNLPDFVISDYTDYPDNLRTLQFRTTTSFTDGKINELTNGYLYHHDTQYKSKIIKVVDETTSPLQEIGTITVDEDIPRFTGTDRTFIITGNTDADPGIQFADELYIINRKINENPQFIQFELASPIDLPDVVVPKRKIYSDHCQWRYRGAECGYTGGDVATANDIPINNRMGRPDYRFDNYGQFLLHSSVPISNRIRFDIIEHRVAGKPVNIAEPIVGAFFYIGRLGKTGTWDVICPTITDVKQKANNVATGNRIYEITLSRDIVKLENNEDSVADYIHIFSSPKDVCSKKLKACKFRFGEYSVLPFGGFPGAAR